MFDGMNMEISDFISRVEKAAQLDGAQGSDICLQIVFFMQGKALAKEVQEMVEWETLKQQFVQRWGSMMPLLKHTRAELDMFITQSQAFGIKTQRQFQDFSIKLDNLIAYLLHCHQMTNVKDIRHTQAIDGSHILPPYRTIMEYIGRELKTMSILHINNWSKEAGRTPVNAPQAPHAQALPRDRALDDLSKTLAGWNVQRQPGFTSASHIPYKLAQYNQPPSSLKCHYCFGDAHTLYRCNMFSQDEFNNKVYQEGQDYKLPNGTSSHFDRSRPIKAVVERYTLMSRPPATPGILNLPLGTQTKKEKQPAEVQSLFGKLKGCQLPKLATYESDAVKRLRNGKEIVETPSAKKTCPDTKEDIDVDEDIMATSNKDFDPFPGYSQAKKEKENIKKGENKKEKPVRKSFLEKVLAKGYTEPKNCVVQQMVGEGRMELSH
ncbi:hypothetical protein H4Q26_001891 [Puccinia striiformis f. sp. tritici PST-130]|nr:hypothetical protein H4Q26_001891 [Puccinia striiformis f. sp. tritici PST-130]